MNGDICQAHVATNIHRRGCHGRDVVLCEAVVPPGAETCTDCGEPAPRVRIDRFWQDLHLRLLPTGDVEATAMRGHRSLKRKAVAT